MTPQVAAALLSSLILTAVLTVMWRMHRERWLGLWAIAALLWAIRYSFALLDGDVTYAPGALVLPLFAIARGFFVLWGAYALERRPLPRAWIAIFAVDLLVLAGERVFGELVLVGARGVPHYALFGSATLWASWMVLGARRQIGNEAMVVAAGLAALGALNLTFPWTSGNVAMAPLLFLSAHGAQLIIGFGALMVFYRRAIVERDAAQQRLEGALAKALSGFLPICGHCKSIRSERGEWEPVERYVSTRTGAAFSHGLCPNCQQEHYPEFFPADASDPGRA